MYSYSKTELQIVPLFKETLDLWKLKQTFLPEEMERLYMLTANQVEWIITNKKTTILQNLPNEYLSAINQFFFMTYDRIANEEDVHELKPAKLFPIHQDLISKGKIGMMHRSLFATIKTRKKDDNEEKE